MIILLSKDEDEEMAKEFLNHLGADVPWSDVPNLFRQTKLDHEDMDFKIDIYVR